MTRLAIIALLLLTGCGADYATYEAPPTAASRADESDYHRCMRQTPVLHRNECRELQ